MRYLQTFYELNQSDVFDSKILRHTQDFSLNEQSFWRDGIDNILSNETFNNYYSWASVGISILGPSGMAVSTAMDVAHALSYLWMAYGTKRDGSNFWKTEEEKTGFLKMFLIEAACALAPTALKVVAKEYKAAMRLGKIPNKLLEFENWLLGNSSSMMRKIKQMIPGMDGMVSSKTVKKLQDKSAEIEAQIQMMMSRKKSPTKSIPIKDKWRKITDEVVDNIKNGVDDPSALKMSESLFDRVKNLPKYFADYTQMKAVIESSGLVASKIMNKMGFKEGDKVVFAIFDKKRNEWISKTATIKSLVSKFEDGKKVYSFSKRKLIKLGKEGTEDIAGEGMDGIKIIIDGEEAMIPYYQFFKHVLPESPKVYVSKYAKTASKAAIRALGWLLKNDARVTDKESKEDTKKQTEEPKAEEKPETKEETAPKELPTQEEVVSIIDSATEIIQKDFETNLPKEETKQIEIEDTYVSDLSKSLGKDFTDVEVIVNDLGGVDEFKNQVRRLSTETGKSESESSKSLINNNGDYESAKNSLSKDTSKEPKTDQQTKKVSKAFYRSPEYEDAVNTLIKETGKEESEIRRALNKSAGTDGKFNLRKARRFLESEQ